MAFREYLIGEVAEEFSEGLLSRREAVRRLGLLGLAVPGATALLAACGGGDDDAAAPTPPPMRRGLRQNRLLSHRQRRPPRSPGPTRAS